MKLQSFRQFLAKPAARCQFCASRLLLSASIFTVACALNYPLQAANTPHTFIQNPTGNISDSTLYSAGGAPNAATAGDILQDFQSGSTSTTSTLTLDIPVTIGTIKLNSGGTHNATFSGPNAFTLDNTGGTVTNIFGNTSASIGQNANAGLLTIAANVIAANAALDIGSTQVGTVTISGNITSSNASGTTLNLRQNATQTSTTITDQITGNIGATGNAIFINNLSSGGGGNTKDIFSISGAIGGTLSTGATVTITNVATGTSPFNISGALGAK